MISTTAWTVAAVLAALGVGAWAYKKKQATDAAAVAASPKAQYDLGRTAGYTAGHGDALAKSLPKVAIAAEQVDTIIKNPASWMGDPKKAYVAGYNVGYFHGYQDGLLGKSGTTMEGKVLPGPWIPPSTKPTDWPTGCVWPPKSKAEMDSNLAKARAYTSDPMAIAQPSWWPSALGWPPICPPATWPKSVPWPPKSKKQLDAVLTPGPVTMHVMREGSSMFGSALESMGIAVAKTPCETAFDALPEAPLSYTSDSDRSYATTYTFIQDWALAMYNSGTSLEKWIASRVLNREANAAEAAGADASYISNLRTASDCLAVPITPDDLSAGEKSTLAFIDLPEPFYTNTVSSMTVFPSGERVGWETGGRKIANSISDQGFDRAAHDIGVQFPESGIRDGDKSRGDPGVHGTVRSDPSTGFVPRHMLGGRISQEWKNQIPQWYFHNSFRSMRG